MNSLLFNLINIIDLIINLFVNSINPVIHRLDKILIKVVVNYSKFLYILNCESKIHLFFNMNPTNSHLF